MLGWRVKALVAFGMSIYVIMGVPYCVCDRDCHMNFHKGRCHMVKVIFCSVSLDTFSPKITASHRMHESTADANFWLCFELVHIWAVDVFDPVEEPQPKNPSCDLAFYKSLWWPLLAWSFLYQLHDLGGMLLQKFDHLVGLKEMGAGSLTLKLFGYLISESLEKNCLSWHSVFTASARISCRRSLSSCYVHGISPPHCECGRRLGHDLIWVSSQKLWSCNFYWGCNGMEWQTFHCQFGPQYQLLMLYIPWCWEWNHVAPPLWKNYMQPIPVCGQKPPIPHSDEPEKVAMVGFLKNYSVDGDYIFCWFQEFYPEIQVF